MQPSDTKTVLLVSDKQVIRNQIKIALSQSRFGFNVTSWPERGMPIDLSGAGSVVIIDGSQSTFDDVLEQARKIVAERLSILIIANAWSMAERLKLRTLGRVDVTSSAIDRDELSLRLEAFERRSERLSVLIIEDDKEIAEEVSLIFQRHGFDAVISDTIADARLKATAARFDLLIVDRRLPDGEGLDFIRGLRTRDVATPALVVTAEIRTEQRIEGLKAGANDYMCKPFDPDELLARAEVLLQPIVANRVMRYGALELNEADGLVRWGRNRIDLTDTEFKVLLYLAQRAGLVLPITMLEADIWNSVSRSSETNVVAAAVRRLRIKLEGAGVPNIVRTEGKGYRFDADAVLMGSLA
jgi:two-component system, OmpR family, response regulator